MRTASLLTARTYHPAKPVVELLLETAFTKEIRILLRAGQVMRRHQTPFPIVVEVVEGQVAFGLETQVLELQRGDLITLAGGVPHDVEARTDSTLRLTLSTQDRAARVAEVAAHP